jgi:uncharacterized membrane protein YeaQ/YmgE (transglycosylase-associated protein family)
MIAFIIFGLIVGYLARLFLPGRQRLTLLATLIIGVLGAIVGGVIANALGKAGDVFDITLLSTIVSVLAAMVMIVVAEGGSVTHYRGRGRGRTRSRPRGRRARSRVR